MSTAVLTDPVERTRYSGLLGAEDPTAPFTAWQVALDRIELDVLRAEHRLPHGIALVTDRWDVPEDHGPLPAALRERAEDIVARQQLCLARMAEQLGSTHRQVEVADAIGRATGPDHGVPIYVDVNL